MLTSTAEQRSEALCRRRIAHIREFTAANRLASNSLLEALVFGRRAAQDIQRSLESGYSQVEVKDYEIKPQGAPFQRA